MNLYESFKKNLNEADEVDFNKVIDNDMTIKELDDTAQWLYENLNRDNEWAKFTDNEILELAKLCQYTEENPWGRPYDDEVFDELDRRGLSLQESCKGKKKKALKEAEESKHKNPGKKKVSGDKVTSDDLNGPGVNFKIDNNGEVNYLTAFWSSDEPFPTDEWDEERAEWESPDDVWGIYFEIYNANGDEVDGGELLTYDEDEWDAKELCKDMLGLCGREVDPSAIEHLENGNYEDVMPFNESAKIKEAEKSKKVTDDKIGKTYVCKKEIVDPMFGTQLGVGEVVTLSYYDPENGYLPDVQDFYITEDMIKNNLEEYTGPVFGCYNQYDDLLSKQSTRKDAEEYKKEREDWSDDEVYIEKINESHKISSKKAKCPKCGKKVCECDKPIKEADEDEWTEEDFKRYAVEDSPEGASEEEININLMWSYVCSNKLDLARKLLSDGIVDPNAKYHRFNNDNSFIMGALRNGNYEMVDLLKSFGGTILNSELDEYKSIMGRNSYEDDITKSVIEEAETPALIDDDISEIAVIMNSVSDKYAYAIQQALEKLVGLGYKGITGSQGSVNVELANGRVAFNGDGAKVVDGSSFSEVELERINDAIKAYNDNLNNNRNYDFDNDKWLDEAVSIPRNAKKVRLGADTYSKDGSSWKKDVDPEEKSFGIPTRYGNDFFRSKGYGTQRDDDFEVLEVDEEYKPKRTRSIKVLQGNYGYGWDDLLTYDSDSKEDLEDLRARYKEYKDNEPNAGHRIINRRVPLDESVYALNSEYGGRNSYYGKALVEINSDGKTLYSYGTPIMRIKDGNIEMLCGEWALTNTTIRHIREFMQQEGLGVIPKAKLVKLINEQNPEA